MPPKATEQGPPIGEYQRQAPTSIGVARLLVDFLLSGEVSPGTRIPSERQLVERLGIGRSAVREALKSLTLLGLLDVRPGDGTYLVGSASDLLPQIIEWGLLLGERRIGDLVETRTHLEITLAELAATRRTEAQVAELEAILSEMSAAGDDLDRYIAADVAFHLKIAELSGNEVLRGIHTSVRSLLEVWTRRVIESYGETAFSYAVHEPIFHAIRDGKARAARTTMTKHMKQANRHLSATLTAEATTPA
ncbi:FadR/GntR family transcriptional regulator [Streptomyces sp. NPDC001661]